MVSKSKIIIAWSYWRSSSETKCWTQILPNMRLSLVHEGNFISKHSSLPSPSYVNDAWAPHCSQSLPDVQEFINFIPPLAARCSRLLPRTQLCMWNNIILYLISALPFAIQRLIKSNAYLSRTFSSHLKDYISPFSMLKSWCCFGWILPSLTGESLLTVTRICLYFLPCHLPHKSHETCP